MVLVSLKDKEETKAHPHRKKADVCDWKPGRELLSGYPDLRLPILQNYDKYIPVVRPPSRRYFVILAQTKTMI